MKYAYSGGINELNDIAISDTEAISGQNFELGLGNTKFRPRKPFDLLAQTPNVGQINGIHQLVKRDNTKTTLVASGAAMYSWNGAVSFVTDTQDETSYDNSPTTEGIFSGGTGHVVSDVITITGGTTVTVDAVSTGVVTQFTIDSSADTTGGYIIGDVLSQTSTDGSGLAFTLTLDLDNLTGFASELVINTAGEYHSFDWDLDQTIIITDRNKVNALLEWDGTTCAALTHGIAGVTTFYAKYGIVANGRTILANVTTDSTENPHLISFSEFENRENYDTATRGGDAGFSTGNEPFYILSPDLKPINGLVKFKDLVIISTENGELFKLVGDDSTNYRFEDFYKGSAAIGDNSIVNAGDDVYFMRAGGVIESLRATDTYGDVGTDDISLPIRDTTKDLTGVRPVYDQTNRKILFFTGSSVIVLYKDLLRSEESPYSIYKTAHTSNFSTSAVEYVEYQTSTDKTVLFGDDSGNIYDLNGSGLAGDSGTASISVSRKSALQDFDYGAMLKGRIFYRRRGQCDFNLQYDWGDENNTTSNTVTLKGSLGGSDALYFGGTNYFGGTVYFAEGVVSGKTPVSQGFSSIGKGSSVFLTIGIDTVEDFEVDYLEI